MFETLYIKICQCIIRLTESLLPTLFFETGNVMQYTIDWQNMMKGQGFTDSRIAKILSASRQNSYRQRTSDEAVPTRIRELDHA